MFIVNIVEKILLTKHSTFRLREKQEERGSVQTLAEICILIKLRFADKVNKQDFN